MERRTPFPAKERKQELADTGLGVSKEGYSTGLCPVCQQKMVVTSLKQNGDRPVYVCLTHRVCLPLSK